MNQPQTQYVKTPGGYVAYQVFGDGPIDILFIANWGSNLDVMWEDPNLNSYMDRLASFSRVIFFDKRGSGVSDSVPLAALPTLEQWMDDAREVLDAVKSQRAVVIGDCEGGFMAVLFAATYSKRVSALILINASPRMLRADDYPIGYPTDAKEKLMEAFERSWGSGWTLEMTAPGRARDSEFRDWFARFERLAMPPGFATVLYNWAFSLDVRSVLPVIKCPTLILHRTSNDHYRIEYGRYLASHISDSKLIELEGTDCHPFFASDTDPILDSIQEFLIGMVVEKKPKPTLATIMFTDIVESTNLAIKLGDRKWADQLEDHNVIVRSAIKRYWGKEIKTTGDGFLASFDGPARAISCARDISIEVQTLGMDVRIGLHTGEVELTQDDAKGIAVHLAARITDEASGKEIFVSRTVKDLVAGSAFEFSNRGERLLKGIPEKWQLYSVEM